MGEKIHFSLDLLATQYATKTCAGHIFLMFLSALGSDF